jgi:dTMP kinase
MFITFEGVEGSGKTVQAKLLADSLAARGLAILLTREPGGTDIGDQIRAVLHDTRNTAMLATTEILLYSAARAQIVGQSIRPALAGGQIVISDRYADSTLAYQGYGRGLDLDALRFITAFATGGLTPDITFFLDVDVEEGLRRKQKAYHAQGDELNRMDQQSLDFYRRVRAGYLTMVACEPRRWVVLNGQRDVQAVHADVRAVVDQRMREGRRAS